MRNNSKIKKRFALLKKVNLVKNNIFRKINKSSLKGFTLIELMIIVAIISVLTVIALPKFGKIIQKAKEGRTKGSLGAFRSAINIYYADNEGYLPYWDKIENVPPLVSSGGGIINSNWSFFVPKYIDEIPGVYTGQRNAWGQDKFGNTHEGNNRIALFWSVRMGSGAVMDTVAGKARPNEAYEYLYFVCEAPQGGTEDYNGDFWINCDLLDTKEEKFIFW